VKAGKRKGPSLKHSVVAGIVAIIGSRSRSRLVIEGTLGIDSVDAGDIVGLLVVDDIV